MADGQDDKGRKELEEQIWSAIRAFEQILEAMPDDRASLETLAHAYGQIGDDAKSYAYLVRLGRVLVNEDDKDSALEILDRLRELNQGDQAGTELIADIEAMLGGHLEAEVESAGPDAVPAAVDMGPSISEEMAFTWNLLQAGDITQEEYASIVHDLTEMSGSESSVTVSVLHALEARSYKGLDRIVARVSQECFTPFISLDSIDISEAAGSQLPLAFVVRRGTLVFDFLGAHALAVVMNPYDASLRKDVEQLSGKACHFFMTHASEFDRAVERITNIEVQSAGSE